ncbi:uncharacterized protein LOC135203813 [Macrobrachium nipponense]|uniref:uncharacterized protein LOC135203813 n=1 Tax=Macrobrachium nipponense TaxID=159736 RepID=UPI0030C8458C
MNSLIFLCALVAGATATNLYQGLLGYSGIVTPDGKNVQFTREQADNIVLVGPSGAVTRDGNNFQLAPDTHRTKRSNSYQGLLGYSGIVRPDGNNVQFTREQADNIVLVGPSGAVTKDGKNLQLVPDTHRTKRSNFYQGLLGYSGIVSPDGNNVQFTREQADNIVLLTFWSHPRISIPCTQRTKLRTYQGFGLGYSGIVSPDGNNVQFTREQADNIVLVGPSGAVTKDGKNMQLVPDNHRVKRGAGYVNAKGSIGYSGIVKTDGTIRQFSQDDIDNIVLFGPSGVVTKDGKNWQLDEDLNIHRTKRHLIGPSGLITRDGTPVQFKEAGAKILLEGPSGLIMSDGTLVHLRS